MRKPPRLATLLVGLLVVGIAIWRFFSCAAAPPPAVTMLLATASSAAPSPSGSARVRAPERAAPIALLSASTSPDDAALGAFEGRVVSGASGRGIAGAHILVEHEDEASQITCGADGAFRFVPPAPGTFTVVRAFADGYRPFAPEPGRSAIAWTARPGVRVAGFVLVLDPATPFTIAVVSPDGKPVAGAKVRVLDDGENGPGSADLVTDAQGEVRAPLPEDALVEARHEGFAPGRTRVTLVAEASHELTIRLRSRDDRTFAADGEAIDGRVVDASGAPVSGAHVAARFVGLPAAVNGDLHPSGEDSTDAHGAFRIEGLDPGVYDLVATDGEHAPGRASGVGAPSSSVVLRLGSAGSIRGVVRAANGSAAAAFSVVVSRRLGPLERERVAAPSFLDAEGRYEIDGVGPGTYEVVAVALDAAPSVPAVVTISDPPGAPATADLTLQRGAQLRGTVLDAETKKPIEGAHVALDGVLGGEKDVPLSATATTTAEGTFELRGLAAGLCSLTVTAASHHGRIVSGILVGAADPLPIEVNLTPTKKGEEPRLELVGIGAVLTAKDDALVIGQVIAGGGAVEAGLGPGDSVLAIDGAKVTDLGFEGSIQRIRGPEGSSVVLTVRKGGATDALDIVVVRRRIKG